MTTLEELTAERAGIHRDATAIVAGAKAAGRELSTDDLASLEERFSKITDLDAKITNRKRQQEALATLGGLTDEEAAQDNRKGNAGAGAKSLGEHWLKGIDADRWRGERGYKMVTDEWVGPETKAATDNQVVGSVFAPVLTEFRTSNMVQQLRQRLVVADLLGSGTISGNAVTYLIEAGVEGAFTTVAEAGQKPQIHYLDPTTATDALKKIAAFYKITDEMMEDLPFIVSQINNRLLYNRALFEEQQLMGGAGTGTTILGLQNRSGVQTVARGTIASGDTAPEALFRAITAVATASGLTADGIMIHPTDYQTIRLMKDGNGQYFGGGFFAGQYGVGGIMEQPPIWGLRTVVTPAVAQGTAMVGAFAQAATVYRKGGIRVETTNSDGTDFTKNISTVRCENRVALAVERPSALVKVTLTAAP